MVVAQAALSLLLQTRYSKYQGVQDIIKRSSLENLPSMLHRSPGYDHKTVASSICIQLIYVTVE